MSKGYRLIVVLAMLWCCGCGLTDEDSERITCLSDGWATAEGTAHVRATENGTIQTTFTPTDRTASAEASVWNFTFGLFAGDNTTVELLIHDAVLHYDPEGLLLVYDDAKAVLMRTEAFGSPCSDDDLEQELGYAGRPVFQFQGSTLTREEPE